MALYTHTHTSTFREIKRVANEATLYCVVNRLFVALYEGKNKVLEIACFLSSRKIINDKEILRVNKINLMRKFYTEPIITKGNLTKIGGVE